jgi:hypothetical protein
VNRGKENFEVYLQEGNKFIYLSNELNIKYY